MKRTIVTIAGLAIAGLSVTACSTQHLATAPAATTSAPATPASSAPAPPSAPASSSAPLNGPVGTTYTDSGDNGPNDSATVYSVTLVKVDQQAELGQYETLTNGIDHVAAVEFSVTGKSGESSDDADSDAVTVGSDQQDYQPSFDTITEGTNFNDGDFNVSAGQTVIGWVAFELAPGVTIASVQWSPGLDSEAATWTVGS